jgi:hypothetical protein
MSSGGSMMFLRDPGNLFPGAGTWSAEPSSFIRDPSPFIAGSRINLRCTGMSGPVSRMSSRGSALPLPDRRLSVIGSRMSVRASRLHMRDAGTDIDGSTTLRVVRRMSSDGSLIPGNGSRLQVLDPRKDSADPLPGLRDPRQDGVERPSRSIEPGMEIIDPPTEIIEAPLKIIEAPSKIIDAARQIIDLQRESVARLPSRGAPAPSHRGGSRRVVARVPCLIAPVWRVIDDDRSYT